MKKILFSFLFISLSLSSVFAVDGVKNLSEFENNNSEMLTSKKYVDSAYNVLNSAIIEKQKQLEDFDSASNTGNVKQSGSGNIVTSVTASDGTVTVQRANVSIPVGSANASNYSTIWLE
ncbi:MAG: hypothetical protein MJ158_03140 [Alphaproteobacteria bacterium]|nr:hypothetical protein [Alphaproteobacteria bacterium]